LQEDIESTFSVIVKPGTARDVSAMKKKRETKRLKRLMKDEENYIGYQAKDHHTEEG
jgi:hypothetical protein